jgi:uncharacterized protein (TIGR02246 family)
MDAGNERMVADLVGGLERAWNEGDGAAFAAPFAEDADFVNIRGEHARTREAIAQGHQGIFNTIYKGSTVRYEVAAVRRIARDVLVAHVRSRLNAPAGPLAGEHRSLFTMVLVHAQNDWRIAAFHNTLMV